MCWDFLKPFQRAQGRTTAAFPKATALRITAVMLSLLRLSSYWPSVSPRPLFVFLLLPGLSRFGNMILL